MELLPGTILEGTVKSITSFGAFITLPEGRSGLVHISEVADTYVSDIRQHLTPGQNVLVKVLGVDEKGRVSLSVRRAREQPRLQNPRCADQRPAGQQRSEPKTFEEKLKQFMADSDEKISGVRQYEHKTRSRRK